mgnify:CR=1 FL=1
MAARLKEFYTNEVAPAMMKKFEYKVISVPRAIPIGAKGYEKMVTEFETNLNKLGAEGWELVQRADDFLFFKREISVE